MKTATLEKPKKTKTARIPAPESADTRTPEPPVVSVQIPKTDSELPTLALWPSAENRDLTEDDVAADLLQSIRAVGIHTRLWVYALREKDKRRKQGGTHEIIAGERRWIGAKAAGLETVPVTIYDCTEKQADELRLIENLQRRDLTALEEGQRFARMIDKHGYQVNDPAHPDRSLVHTLGKSESYLYGRIKLSQLPKLAAQAVASGELAPSVALRIARIPDLKLQVKCTTEVLQGRFGSGPMTDKVAAEHIANHYMTQLKGAPFDQKDPDLVPVEMNDGQRLLGGACTDCPFRSGNQSEMFADSGEANGKGKSRGDVCTNPTCFAQKKDAAWKRACNEAKRAGKVVVPEKEAQNVFQTWGDKDELSSNCRYVRPSDKCPEDPEKRTYRELLNGDGSGVLAVAPHVVRSPRSGKVHELLVRAEVKNAITVKGFDFYTKQSDDRKERSVEQLISSRKESIAEADAEWRLGYVVDQLAGAFGDYPVVSSIISKSLAYGVSTDGDPRLATLSRWHPLRPTTKADDTVGKFLSGLVHEARIAFLTEIALRNIAANWRLNYPEELAALEASLGISSEEALERHDSKREAHRQVKEHLTIPVDFDTLQMMSKLRSSERMMQKRPVLSFDWNGRKYLNADLEESAQDCWEMIPRPAYEGETHTYGSSGDYGNEGLIVTQKGVEYVLRGPRIWFTQRRHQCRDCGSTELQPGQTEFAWADTEFLLCTACTPTTQI